MNYAVCIPSKGRAGIVSTTQFFNSVYIFVPEDEVKEYRVYERTGHKVIGVPLSIRGITATRNFILDWVKEQGFKYHIQIDDDVEYFYYFENTEKIIKTDKDWIDWLITRFFILIEDMGVYLWGLSLGPDKKFYREYSPFSLVSVIGANLFGIKDNPIRFDERLKVKEDYDYALMHLYRYGRVVRSNKYGVKVKHYSNRGGCVSYRTAEVEEEAYRILRKKWGKIIKRQRGKTIGLSVESPYRGI